MAKISQMPAPGPLTGLELTPLLQGGGIDGNVGVPILAYGNLPRGQVLLLRTPMTSDLSSTAAANPGSGKVRWNNADPNAATAVFVNKADADAEDIAALLLSAEVGGYLYLQANGAGDSARRDAWQKWQIVSVDDETGYVRIGVLAVASSDAMEASEAIELTLQQPAPAEPAERNAVTAVSSSGGVVLLDYSLGDYFTLELTENVTSWSIINTPGAGRGFTLMVEITQDSTPRTVATPGTTAGGAPLDASTTAGAVDLLAISSFDNGSTLRSSYAKGFA